MNRRRGDGGRSADPVKTVAFNGSRWMKAGFGVE